jgi:formate/nitrite transporter FocA (FNT family)
MSKTRSDLVTAKGAEEISPKKAAAQILRQEIREGKEVLERPAIPLFVSALSGGLDVGFSLFLMAAMYTLAHDHLPEPVVAILVANMYSVGFIFVVIGRSELFTEQTSLAVLPVLRGSASVASLLRAWGIVYAGNLLGATGFAALASYIGPKMGVIEPSSFGFIAHRMVDHAGQIIFLSAVLAGWLMGLLGWMVTAGRDTISQIVIVWLVTTAIGFGGFHHVVLGTVEVLAGVFSNQGITLFDFAHFLLWTTLGNALGGSVFVALIKYGHARQELPAN